MADTRMDYILDAQKAVDPGILAEGKPEENSYMGWSLQKRIRVYSKVFISIYLIFSIYKSFFGSGLLDPFGNPVGADFLAFWSISKVLITEDAKEVYNQNRMFEAQKKIIGASHEYPTFYPPSSLILIAPLSFLSYIPSFIIWISITFLFFLLMLYRIAPNPTTIWLAIAFPGTFLNISFGQNGFLVGGLIGGGLLLMGRSPFLAGAVLGLSVFKPHIAILIPFALLVQRNWKALSSMLLTIGFLITLSIFLFGLETWYAFLNSLPNAMEIIEKHEVRLYNMTSIMAMSILLGASATGAKIAHAAIASIAFALVIWIWFKRSPFFLRASSLILGTLLIPPYLHVYDLALIAMPIAWMGWEAFRSGNSPARVKYYLSAGWIMPLFTMLVAKEFKIQLAPFFILCLLVFSFFWAYQIHRNNEFPKNYQ